MYHVSCLVFLFFFHFIFFYLFSATEMPLLVLYGFSFSGWELALPSRGWLGSAILFRCVELAHPFLLLVILFIFHSFFNFCFYLT